MAGLRNKEYRKYLMSAHWKERRRSRIAQNPKCERCGLEGHLVVHHKTYERLGNELDADLEVLCKWCHNEHHGAPWRPRPKMKGRTRRRQKFEKEQVQNRIEQERGLAGPTKWDMRERLLNPGYWGQSA